MQPIREFIMAGLGDRKWWALVAVTLAVLAVGLDGTILSVALPTLSRSLRASESDLQWFSSGYLLVLAAGMLPAGAVGDRFGRRATMLAALALFGLGSVGCAYSRTPGEFIAARVVLGVAGAGVIVMALSSITVLFTKQERPKAVGIWAAANFVALPIGPILGGWLLTHYWWGWVFLINVPVALIGLIATATLIPESRAATTPALDPLGMTSSVGGLAALTYGLILAGEFGWSTASVLSWIGAGLVVLIGFGVWEYRLGADRALVDMSLFRNASFTWGVVLAAVGVLAMIGVLFTLPQYFQAVVGTDAMGSGVRLLPVVGGLIVGALPADQICRRIGAKATVAIGFAVLASGLAIGARTTADSGTAFLATWTALTGAGLGLSMATAASSALCELSAEQGGVGSAVMQALQKTGGPLGAAIMGSVLSSAYRHRLVLDGLPKPAAAQVEKSVFAGVSIAGRLRSPELLGSVRVSFAHGMDIALLASSVIALLGFVLALAFLPSVRPVRSRSMATE